MGWKLSISWQEWGELEESHSNEQHEDNDMERPILAPSDFVERNSVGRNVGFWILVKFWSFPVLDELTFELGSLLEWSSPSFRFLTVEVEEMDVRGDWARWYDRVGEEQAELLLGI